MKPIDIEPHDAPEDRDQSIRNPFRPRRWGENDEPEHPTDQELDRDALRGEKEQKI
jgi:hypothetical protein